MMLRNKKLVPPDSLTAGVERREQLESDIAKIETQLADPTRITRYPSATEYDAWQTSAKHALACLSSEARQLDEWIESRRHDVEEMLLEAWDLLQTLEIEVEFDEKEQQFMTRLDQHFSNKKAKKTA